MKVEKFLSDKLQQSFQKIYGIELDSKKFVVNETRKEFDGDFTLVVFPLASIVKQKPEEIASRLGDELLKTVEFVENYNVIKGFLNIKLKSSFWISFLRELKEIEDLITKESDKKLILIEFPSPNTNKPLHLGHIRNMLLGESLSRIIETKGHKVVRINLINDRGIHITKTMLAWLKWGDGKTPEQLGIKGDHYVGDLYVRFEKELKKEIEQLEAQGLTKEEALKRSKLMQEAQQLLRDWEAEDQEVRKIWKMMNNWVLEGFDQTFKELGIKFDKVYYESEVYKKGIEIILENLRKGIVKKNTDGSVFIDLEDVGLGQKILLRSDGTAVYITQDIANAVIRFEEYNFDKHYYVVANEQIYHFQVLKEVLKRFGYNWYDRLEHYSYGMVELPEGKMKSREGKVVDADDLIEEMYQTADLKTKQLGKLEGMSEEQKQQIIKIIGLGALKYFILKVEPRKNMLFKPQESIDFDGNTGPFIQYSYTRINSLLKKAQQKGFNSFDYDNNLKINEKELNLIKQIYNFDNVLQEAYQRLSPSLIANYVYNLAKSYNSFYQEFPVLYAEEQQIRNFRLRLSAVVKDVLKFGLNLLGIDVPEKM